MSNKLTMEHTDPRFPDPQAAMAMTSDPTLCTGLDGCGGQFPNKSDIGLCARCTLVKQFEDAGEAKEAEKIMNEYIHCRGCGACGKRFDPQIRMCGRCHSLSDATSGLARQPEALPGPIQLAAHGQSGQPHLHALQEESARQMAAARSNAFQARMNKAPSASKAAVSRTVPPGPRVGLLPPPTGAHAGASSHIERYITLDIQARLNKELFHALGSIKRAFTADTEMDDIVRECIRAWNKAVWDSKASASLTEQDVSLRWIGNIMPYPGTEHRTLGEFYDIHKTLPNRDDFFSNKNIPLAMRNSKVEYLCLEIQIDSDMFEDRTGFPAPKQAKASSGRGRPPKRERPGDSTVTGPNAKKTLHLGTQLTTTFRAATPRRGLGGSIQPAQQRSSERIKLQIATAAFNMQQEFTISWESLGDSAVRSAAIGTSPEMSGKTKKVFRLDFDDKNGGPGRSRSYVAKRFFEVGNGTSHVTCEENRAALILDAERLALAQMCLKEFYRLAETQGAEVSQEFTVTEWLLAQESIELSADASPSMASGISKEVWNSDASFSEWDAGLVWLIEPRRSATVTRWSGTMQQSNRTNKRQSTMGAFAHFSFLWSEKESVFVDLQSSHGWDNEGNEAQVLFDIMTHTRDGNSGVGDHGLDGLRKFAEDHECNAICAALQLEPLFKDEVLDGSTQAHFGTQEKGKGKQVANTYVEDSDSAEDMETGYGEDD
ncbi:hypothetical protein C8Q79DRAFT_316050 [Trametes meyenii]|nr:hypothetical protein C8Q79DRAFT_316050 [Trametes meyenii]